MLALLFAVPALAWWVGGRAVWSRPGRRAEPDLFRELVRRHALRPAEIAEVEGAVTWGRELQEPRLRAAVVDWAESYQRLAAERSARHPRARRVVAAVLLVCGVLAVARLVPALVDGRWAVLQGLLWPLVLLPVQLRLARGRGGRPSSTATRRPESPRRAPAASPSLPRCCRAAGPAASPQERAEEPGQRE